MNEISRCCRLLGVKHGASFEEVKKIYRDLVQVWHPDRFSGNERLAAKAQGQLTEINLAYEYLVAHAFQDGVLVEPADDSAAGSPTDGQTAPDAAAKPAPGWPDEEPEIKEAAGPRNIIPTICGAAALLAVCGILLYLHLRGEAKPAIAAQASSNTPALSAQPDGQTNPPPQSLAMIAAKPAPTSAPPPSPAGLFPFTKDVLSGMTAADEPTWLQSGFLLSPPFAIRAKIKLTDLADVHLHYGLGLIIFNWSDHPKELRVHDPRTGAITPAPDKGLILPGAHELVWEISTNQMRVSVDGQLRYEGKGNYDGIKGYPGIGPYQGANALESVSIETPQSLEDPPLPKREHGPINGDILASMVPENGVRVEKEADGVALRYVGDSGHRLMSAQSFQPPFVIRTRAKTDALNLRIYCGKGELIFNWERNPQELRVHDPSSGQQTGLAGRGLITANEWHAIFWEIKNSGMRVYVDGQLRFQNQKDYSKLNAHVGIGPALSRITVDYFQLEKE